MKAHGFRMRSHVRLPRSLRQISGVGVPQSLSSLVQIAWKKMKGEHEHRQPTTMRNRNHVFPEKHISLWIWHSFWGRSIKVQRSTVENFKDKFGVKICRLWREINIAMLSLRVWLRQWGQSGYRYCRCLQWGRGFWTFALGLCSLICSNGWLDDIGWVILGRQA